MSSNQYVVFKVDSKEFALDITQVKEIISPVEIAKVPNVPDFIEGMIDIRGKVHAVINLRSRFHLSKKQFDSDTKIIIINMDSMLIGLIVDAVSEILRTEDKDFNDTPEIIAKAKAEFVRGVIKKGRKMVIILDVDKVLDVAA